MNLFNLNFKFLKGMAASEGSDYNLPRRSRVLKITRSPPTKFEKGGLVKIKRKGYMQLLRIWLASLCSCSSVFASLGVPVQSFSSLRSRILAIPPGTKARSIRSLYVVPSWGPCKDCRRLNSRLAHASQNAKP